MGRGCTSCIPSPPINFVRLFVDKKLVKVIKANYGTLPHPLIASNLMELPLARIHQKKRG